MPNYDIVPEYNIPKPTNRNKVWLTPEGTVPAYTPPAVESDLSKLQKEAEDLESADITVYDTDK